MPAVDKALDENVRDAHDWAPPTVLMYHSVSPQLDPLAVTPDTFRRHLEFIASSFDVVPLERIAQKRVAGARRQIVITFDDAYRDFAEYAFPALAKRGLPSTVFVPTGRIGGWNDWDDSNPEWPRRPLLTADELRTLHASKLVAFGSHTIDHVRMAMLSEREMRRQAVESKRALEALIGQPVTTFSYPYGQLGDYSSRTTATLRQAGYNIAVTTHWGTHNRPGDLLSLRRVYFREGDDDQVVRSKVQGGYNWITWKERLGFVRRMIERRFKPGQSTYCEDSSATY